MKKILFSALALAIMVGCSDEGSTDTTTPTVEQVAATFTTVLQDEISRVSGTDWSQYDQVGVYMTQGGVPESDVNSNVLFTADPNYLTISGDAMYYPVDGSSVNFFAYYPYQADLEDYSVTFSVSSGEVDFMTSQSSSLYSASNPDAKLSFYHRMCKVYVDINFDEVSCFYTEGAVTAVSLSGPSEVTYDFKTYEFEQVTKGSVNFRGESPSVGVDTTFQALVVPGGTSLSDYNLTVTIIDENGNVAVKVANLDAYAISLNAGDAVTIPVTVQKTEMVLSDGIINDWTNAGSTETVYTE
ncbi:MAG: fimbrillin family protein [Rikenellaceae bacterium]